MNIKYYIDKGYDFFCDIERSDKYVQGVTPVGTNLTKEHRERFRHPGVYIFTNKQGGILKIGQTSNIFDRINIQYKCVSNTTNNRIREHIRQVESVSVYIYLTPEQEAVILGHTVFTSYAVGLERELLKEYVQVTKTLPALNKMVK